MATRKDVAELIAGKPSQVIVTAAFAQELSRKLINLHASDAEAIATTLGALIIMVARSGVDAVDVLDEVMTGLANARSVLESRFGARSCQTPAVLS